jgi:metastasis-associated protein MTA
MWKTTDRYVQQKRVKAVEAESKLKQVFIPPHTKPNSALLTSNKSMLNGSSNGSDILALNGGRPCESCCTTASSQWYSWGPAQMNYRLCQTCWSYWKKYGGLKNASRLNENDIDCAIKKRPNEFDEDDRLAHRQTHK